MCDYTNLEYTCMYHGDKDMFERVTCEVKKAKWIPRPEITRLAMAVCSCRKKLKAPLTRERLEEILEYFHNCLSPESQKNKPWPRIVQRYIKDLLDQSWMDPKDYSANRLLYILFKALKEKVFDDLKREGDPPQKDGDDEKSNEDERGKEDKKQRLTAKEFEYMVKRKEQRAAKIRKTYSKFVIGVPMFPSHVRVLEKRTGFRLRTYSVNGTWGIQLHRLQNSLNRSSGTNLTSFIVFAKSRAEAEIVRQQLHPVAKEIQDGYDKKWKKKRDRYRSFMPRYRVYKPDDEDDHSDVLIEESFSSSRRNYGNRPKQVKRQSAGCKNCLMPLDGPESEAINQPCTYHSGSPVLMYAWSCCDKLAIDPKHSKATATDHEAQGCCSGRHTWTVHKKAMGNRKRHSSWSNPFVMTRKMGI